MPSVAAEPLPTCDEVPDYDLPDNVVADQPHQLKALGDKTRMAILDLVLERAASVTELAAALGKPKSTVAHHVEVLRRAGLLRVVRPARSGCDGGVLRPDRAHRQLTRPGRSTPCGRCWPTPSPSRSPSKRPRRRLHHPPRPHPGRQADAFAARLDELAREFTRLPREGDVVYGLIAGVYPTAHGSCPRGRAERERAPRANGPSGRERGSMSQRIRLGANYGSCSRPA